MSLRHIAVMNVATRGYCTLADDVEGRLHDEPLGIATARVPAQVVALGEHIERHLRAHGGPWSFGAARVGREALVVMSGHYAPELRDDLGREGLVFLHAARLRPDALPVAFTAAVDRMPRHATELRAMMGAVASGELRPDRLFGFWRESYESEVAAMGREALDAQRDEMPEAHTAAAATWRAHCAALSRQGTGWQLVPTEGGMTLRLDASRSSSRTPLDLTPVVTADIVSATPRPVSRAAPARAVRRGVHDAREPLGWWWGVVAALGAAVVATVVRTVWVSADAAPARARVATGAVVSPAAIPSAAPNAAPAPTEVVDAHAATSDAPRTASTPRRAPTSTRPVRPARGAPTSPRAPLAPGGVVAAPDRTSHEPTNVLRF